MTYTVSDLSPGDVSLNTDGEYVLPGPGGEIKVHEHTALSSSADVFRYLAELEVTVDGKPHFQKSWTVSVPRASN
jgi:hypothetical protein